MVLLTVRSFVGVFLYVWINTVSAQGLCLFALLEVCLLSGACLFYWKVRSMQLWLTDYKITG